MRAEWTPRVSALIAGAIFGVGLILSGMVDPGKVLAFLDVAGPWDPSLAVVMIGAIGVGAIAFALASRRTTTVIGEPLVLPQKTAIDGRLVLGSVAFGVGWGLSGICPGPAVVSLAAGHVETLTFLVAMLVGLAIGNALERGTSEPAPVPVPDQRAHTSS